ncbi:MAG: hypothetical protein KDA65_02885 [Planctomycetaceae bacterium]|nr:hypothetical protein [Planctomycetaceae bacterium]
MKEEYEAWLQEKVPLHERLTPILVTTIQGMIKQADIDFLSVTGRTKSLKDVKEKIERKQYRNPQKQLTDISGVRVITFFESQVDEVAKIIDDAFSVDADNSLDKSTMLGTDRIGYRSVHYVCDLGKSRAKLIEYKPFSGLKFEIQIRTVLQHAWAELSHDRNYKFSSVLPPQIQRQLNLYAGMLELADKGFDELAKAIDGYQKQLDLESGESFYNQEINSLSVSEFLERGLSKFSFEISSTPSDKLTLVVSELKRYGVQNLKGLKKLFNKEFIDARNSLGGNKKTTYAGLLRDAMLFADYEKYFNRSWGESAWSWCDSDLITLLSKKYDKETVHNAFIENGIMVVE